MIEIKDQMNRTIRLAESPKRIVSLVPSQTELLFDLGCADRVVGITKFCIHPTEWFQTKTRVGGTKNVNFERLKSLKPDLIIANKEENSQADIERLMDLYPTYISDIFIPSDAFQMIEDVGKLVGEVSKAKQLVDLIKADFSSLPKLKGRVLYFIWANPYMVAGNNTFIGSMLREIGFQNAIEDPTMRYQELSVEEIIKINPDWILLSSEPFPFSAEHQNELEKMTGNTVKLVDGELFSWYGSRMTKMKTYFESLFTEANSQK